MKSANLHKIIKSHLINMVNRRYQSYDHTVNYSKRQEFQSKKTLYKFNSSSIFLNSTKQYVLNNGVKTYVLSSPMTFLENGSNLKIPTEKFKDAAFVKFCPHDPVKFWAHCIAIVAFWELYTNLSN